MLQERFDYTHITQRADFNTINTEAVPHPLGLHLSLSVSPPPLSLPLYLYVYLSLVDPQFYVTVTISSVLILAAVIITAKLW